MDQVTPKKRAKKTIEPNKAPPPIALMKSCLIRLLTIASLSLLFGACTIRQRVEPVKTTTSLGTTIAMIPWEDGVRESFADTYQAALEKRGFTVKKHPVGTIPSISALSTTYTAQWS
ncbi:hypothetical protein [Cephaloticoccus primus]|uniref:hypothetical protein n=1 Tax=Cephaloticoccus primus TaxID=1548207 RepID=UPI0018D27EC4|nr:hypothetical protein [Cephaloticoccus primus]